MDYSPNFELVADKFLAVSDEISQLQIVKDAINSTYNSEYTKIEQILNKIVPSLHRHGWKLDQSFELVEKNDMWFAKTVTRVTYMVRNSWRKKGFGEWHQCLTEYPVNLSVSGDMPTPTKFEAMRTYGRSRSLLNFFNLAPESIEDADGFMTNTSSAGNGISNNADSLALTSKISAEIAKSANQIDLQKVRTYIVEKFDLGDLSEQAKIGLTSSVEKRSKVLIEQVRTNVNKNNVKPLFNDDKMSHKHGEALFDNLLINLAPLTTLDCLDHWWADVLKTRPQLTDKHFAQLQKDLTVRSTEIIHALIDGSLEPKHSIQQANAYRFAKAAES